MSERRTFAFPGTRPQYLPDRPWSLDHIKLEVDVDLEKRSITAVAQLTATAVSTSRWIAFDAVELDVSSVSRGRTALNFENDGERLRIDLGKRCQPGSSVTVAITYSTAPRRGLYFVGPDEGYPEKPVQAWSQGQDDDSRYWFPCLDTPDQKATSEVIATVGDGYQALSNGELIGERSTKGRKRYHYRLDFPHSAYLITLVVGEFHVARTRRAGVDISYWAHPDRRRDAKRTLARTPQMIEAFADLFGVPYPYSSYAQVFVGDFIFGGMENTTATTLTDSVLLDERAALDFNIERLVAHELAHQWFGDLVTCRDWGEGWLNEGFATYSEYLWRERADGADEAFMELDAWAAAYFNEDRARYRRTVATRMYHVPLDVFDAHLYQKGGRILHMLRQVLGDEAFFAALPHYLEKHRRGSVETRDLARAVEEATGRSVDWFFDQWVTRGAGHPELSIEVSWDPERGLAQVSVRQTQDVNGETPLFRLPLAVRFRVGRRDVDAVFEITGERHTFYQPLARAPRWVTIDPGKPTLAAFEVEKPKAMWLAELGGADVAADRIDAVRRVAKIGGAQVTRALARALRRDRFWGVQAAAAEALGELRTDAARDALIRGLDALESHHARRAAVKALGSFRGDARAFDAVAAIAAGDESYRVEAEALLSVGRLRCEGSAEILLGALDRESFFDVIRTQAYTGLAELGDPSHVDRLLEGTAYGMSSFGRRAAARAAASLAAGRRDHIGRAVREHLEGLLDDPDFRVQGSAIEALGALGDAAAITALRRTADRDLDGRLRRRGLEVIRDLGAGRAIAEEREAQRARIDALEKKVAALVDRVDKLESTGAGVRKKARSSS
jgi:aminopeptidase N